MLSGAATGGRGRRPATGGDDADARAVLQRLDDLNRPGSVAAIELLRSVRAPGSGRSGEGQVHALCARWYYHATGEHWAVGDMGAYARMLQMVRNRRRAAPAGGRAARVATMNELLDRLDADFEPGSADVMRAVTAANVTLPRWGRNALVPRSDIRRMYFHINGRHLTVGSERADWLRALRAVRQWRRRGIRSEDGDGAPAGAGAQVDDGAFDDDMFEGDGFVGCSDCDEEADGSTRAMDVDFEHLPCYTAATVPGVARAGCLVPIAAGVPFWNDSYIHGGVSIAPYGVRLQDRQSWFLCPLLADACGLQFLYPAEAVPRPAGPLWRSVMRRRHLGVDVTFSWRRVVELVRLAMQRLGIDDASMLQRMDFQAHWPGALQEHLISEIELLPQPLVTVAEQVALSEQGDMMSMLLAQAAHLYANDVQGRFYYQSVHARSGMVEVSAAVDADDDDEVCGLCLNGFNMVDAGEAVAIRCCRKRMHTRCLEEYTMSAAVVNETRMPCMYCRQCLGCLLPHGHCPVHGRRANAAAAAGAAASGTTGDATTTGSGDSGEVVPEAASEDIALGMRNAGAVHETRQEDTVSPAVAADGDESVWAAAEAATSAGEDIQEVRAILRRLAAPPRPLPANTRCPSGDEVVDGRMRRLFRLWRVDAATPEWDGRRRSYQ